ncbi:MAG: hypothetical protein Q8P11_03435 [bacterium]|nr:hypothetical protein [bacterium]
MPKYRPVHIRPSYIPLLLALLFMGVLVAGFVYFSKDPVKEQQQSVIMDRIPNASTTPVSVQKTDDTVTIEKKSREEKNKEYTISLQYPFFMRGKNGIDSINMTSASYMDGMIKKFKDDFFQAKKAETNNTVIGQWSLDMKYRVSYQSSSVFGIVFSIETHEGEKAVEKTIKNFVIDINEKKMVAFDEAVE